MSQLDLFAVATAPASDRRPVVVLDEAAEYDDSDQTCCGVARYSATMQSPRCDWWACGVWVRVERHFGWKPHRWMASVYLELPDFRRTQWSPHEIYVTQDEAAQAATEMATVARAILEAYLRGESVETPDQRRTRAAEEHVAASKACQDAAHLVDEEKAALDAMGESVDRWAQSRRWHEAKHIAETVRRKTRDDFFAAHGWREFAKEWL